LVNFGPVTPEILWLICMGDECMCAIFKGHSLNGSSIASLQVSEEVKNAQSRLGMPGGLHVGFCHAF